MACLSSFYSRIVFFRIIIFVHSRTLVENYSLGWGEERIVSYLPLRCASSFDASDPDPLEPDPLNPDPDLGFLQGFEYKIRVIDHQKIVNKS
jgi:hypothetical protein